MTPNYPTPNVYIEEEALLPPSVAQASTAVPAFIGYTEKAGKDGSLLNKPVRITTLLEYENLFGSCELTDMTVTLTTIKDPQTQSETFAVDAVQPKPLKFLLPHSLRLFFANGGGACYIVSVGGQYNNSAAVKLGDENKDLKAGLLALAKEDEPTLLVCPDAVQLNVGDHKTFCEATLSQCEVLKDRFAIFDVRCANKTKTDDKDNIDKFRNITGELKYGAAYYPYLQTTLSYAYTNESVTVKNDSSSLEPIEPTDVAYQGNYKKLMKFSFTGKSGLQPKVIIKQDNKADQLTAKFENASLTVNLPKGGAEVEAVGEIIKKESKDVIKVDYDASDKKQPVEAASINLKAERSPSNGSASTKKLADYATTNTALYNQIKAAVETQRVILPASPAVAGVYAKVDNNRGVWKAPANVGMTSILGPTVKLSDKEQENFNVDTKGGKSINAIRSFAGRGTLIWGARTLAGNDNEWRYIPVRRLFIMIEESIRKSTAFAVFEPNVAMTWLKVKTMIESYLDNLWRQGALAGATSEQAYFVQVGLGKTMNQQDILEGRMIVKVGIAAVRPAEFIILTFSHKLQEA